VLKNTVCVVAQPYIYSTDPIYLDLSRGDLG
jgi:hypothetical protein